MTGPCNDVPDRLTLYKDANEDISIPGGKLAQHQINGVRFLFDQNKKEKPGVIVSLPSGCGKSVLVAVYISAISQKLRKPVLILYDDDQEKFKWLNRFTKWTSVSKDSIEVDTTNPNVRKEIFISSIEDILKFNRRYWAVVVVKSDQFHAVVDKCQLLVDFKVWITAQDVKKHEQLLRSVYSWLHPLDTLMNQYFDTRCPLYRNELPREILLDLLLENVLFTRTNVEPFGFHYKRKHEPEKGTAPVVSKKNKDATGTKIKRSKKPSEVPSTSTICIDNVVSLHPNASRNSNDDKVTAKSTITRAHGQELKMDVESFIRDNAPLLSGSSIEDTVETEIDVGIAKIQKVPCGSSVEGKHLAAKIDLGNQETGGGKTDKMTSDGNRHGAVDQARKLEVSTSIVKETDSSFDSKMQKMEEKALRKFKGSVLDNIF